MTHETIIEAGRVERHYWRDLWRYRELFQRAGLARRGCPLQADGDRSGLGCHSAVRDNHFRKIGESAVRRAMHQIRR
jgi:hypothetical protein